MKRRTIETMYVGLLAGFAAMTWLLPVTTQSGLLSRLYLTLLGPMALPGGGLQWVAGALVQDHTGEGALRTWASAVVFVLVTVLLALVNVGLVRLLTLAVRAARGRRTSGRGTGTATA